MGRLETSVSLLKEKAAKATRSRSQRELVSEKEPAGSFCPSDKLNSYTSKLIHFNDRFACICDP